MKPFNENAAIRGAIRRVFARSPVVREVINDGKRKVPRYKQDGSRAKVDKVELHCQTCDQWLAAKGFAVDHVDPVVSTKVGFVDWNTFVSRMWCDKSNLARICKPCHRIKTNKERWERTAGQDLIELMALTDKALTPTGIKYLKRFTPKRLSKYPVEYQDMIKPVLVILRSRR